jgi:RecA/RadA recombinase
MSFHTADTLESMTVTTGSEHLNKLLGGGLEVGLMHLFYSDKILREDILRIAVSAQLPGVRGGLDGSVIMIDSNNMVRVDQLNDLSFSADLQPEVVMDNIFISRAFNSSQTYDLVNTKLETFFENVPAKILILPGLADIYHREGLTAESMQQISHMANRLMAFTLKHGIATVISTMPTERSKKTAVGGRALNSCAQVHVLVEETPSRIHYQLVKHPNHLWRKKSVQKPGPRYATTLPLEYFIPELADDR